MILTCEECADAKCGVETSLLGNGFVFQTMHDVQRIRENDCLFLSDTLAVIEVADHLNKVGWVAGILTNTCVNLGIRLGRMGLVSVDIGRDWGIRRSVTVYGSFHDGLSESVKEGWRAKGVSEGNAKNLRRMS